MRVPLCRGFFAGPNNYYFILSTLTVDIFNSFPSAHTIGFFFFFYKFHTYRNVIVGSLQYGLVKYRYCILDLNLTPWKLPLSASSRKTAVSRSLEVNQYRRSGVSNHWLASPIEPSPCRRCIRLFYVQRYHVRLLCSLEYGLYIFQIIKKKKILSSGV